LHNIPLPVKKFDDRPSFKAYVGNCSTTLICPVQYGSMY
jgi:hypothetical protein